MLNNVLMLSNASQPRSVDDAEWYIAQRGLPNHQLRVQFGSGSGALTLSTLDTCHVANGGFIWDGSIIHSYDGQGVSTAIQNIAAAGFPLDGLIGSTYTPMQLNPAPFSGAWGTITGWLARAAYGAVHGNANDILPHGRLGCPGGSTIGDYSSELITRTGERLVDVAVPAAIAAEARFNKSEPHWVSSGGGVPLDATFGFSSSYYSSLMAAVIANGVQWVVDTGVSYRYLTGDASDTVNGTLRGGADVWAWCWPTGAWNNFNSYDAQPWANNFVIRPGAWSCHWYSYQFTWARYFLWNGGAAAFTTIGEPNADAIRDPAQVFGALIGGSRSLMECTALAVVPNSCPVYPANKVLNGATRWIPIGDPLYRPYAVQAPGTRFVPSPAALL